MELYNHTFEEALDQNYEDEKVWINHKNEIQETQNSLKEFVKSCHLDIMVPLGKKAFVRGKLIHTNDVTMSHDRNYFSLVSNSQANEILGSRSEKCDERLEAIGAERKLFQGKLDIPNVFSEQEIVEDYNEETEAEWRKKHKESVRNQKQIEAKARLENKTDADIEEIFDQYEILEDMAGEFDHLDEEEIDDETLSNLISGKLKITESKKRVAHDELDVKSTYILQKYEKNEDNVTKPLPEEDVKVEKKKEKKRRVRFSSMEDIQVIASASEITREPPPPTIQISFTHSPGKFHPDPPSQVSFSEGDTEAPKFAHPGQFVEFAQSLASPKSTVTKSILKSKGGKKKSVNFQPSPRDEQEHNDFESYLRQQVVIGDVIEHKNEVNNEPPVEVQNDSTKKVSRFKEMRSKVK